MDGVNVRYLIILYCYIHASFDASAISILHGPYHDILVVFIKDKSEKANTWSGFLIFYK